MSKVWTGEMVQYLKEIADKQSVHNTVSMINEKFGTNLTYRQLVSRLSYDRLKKGERRNKFKSRTFTDEQFEFFKECCKGKTSSEVAKIMNDKYDLGLTVVQVKDMKSNLRIKSGVDTRFKKGYIPHNKGVHTGFVHENTRPHLFKKGQKPLHTKSVGEDRMVKNTLLTKIMNEETGEENWVSKAKYVWETNCGKIPNDKVLFYLDGNKYNCDISNLTLITKHEHLVMNQEHLRYNEEALNRAAIHIAKLEVAMRGIKNKC
ncbi:HNH endonuclease [Aerococcaceae bacterium zg-B36]|uniref:HNH endonuclease n=1 Tax=Aerococcaceae bacterium zg-252 TaxID=2796928 RepID=UPI001BD8AD56|nr:HNH endonuclease [Aerococcaceae bacterium zg-B36]